MGVRVAVPVQTVREQQNTFAHLPTSPMCLTGPIPPILWCRPQPEGEEATRQPARQQLASRARCILPPATLGKPSNAQSPSLVCMLAPCSALT